MRIAHVSIGALPAVFSEYGGAIQREVGELAREQVRRGHDVLVLSPAAARGSQDVDGVEVVYLRCRAPQPWAHIEFQLRALLTLLRRRRRPHVIHVHSEPELAAARPDAGSQGRTQLRQLLLPRRSRVSHVRRIPPIAACLRPAPSLLRVLPDRVRPGFGDYRPRP